MYVCLLWVLYKDNSMKHKWHEEGQKDLNSTKMDQKILYSRPMFSRTGDADWVVITSHFNLFGNLILLLVQVL
jgi:hypothetical protein